MRPVCQRMTVSATATEPVEPISKHAALFFYNTRVFFFLSRFLRTWRYKLFLQQRYATALFITGTTIRSTLKALTKCIPPLSWLSLGSSPVELLIRLLGGWVWSWRVRGAWGALLRRRRRSREWELGSWYVFSLQEEAHPTSDGGSTSPCIIVNPFTKTFDRQDFTWCTNCCIASCLLWEAQRNN